MLRAPKNGADACSMFVPTGHMTQMESGELLHRLVSAIAFGDRTVRGQISQG